MKFTILIIDDEENIRNGLETNFEMEDYNVKTASNGKDGLQLVKKGDIDLVITDLKMDGISGEDVVRHIVTETPGIPVIVLTGHGSIEEAVELMTKGAFYFLTKPLDLDQLNLIVKRALENRELSISHTMLKKQLEEVGTERTTGRPINNILKEIKILEDEKNKIENCEYDSKSKKEEINSLEKENDKIKTEVKIYEEIKKRKLPKY